MEPTNCYQPTPSPSLDAPWLRVTYGGAIYTPHLVWIRERRYSAAAIRGFADGLGRHRHGIYHLVYFRDGSNRIEIGDRQLDVRAGQLALIDPDVPHNLVPGVPSPVAFLTLLFSYRCGDRSLEIPFRLLVRRLTGRDPGSNEVYDDLHGTIATLFTRLEQDMREAPDRCEQTAAHVLAGVLNEVAGAGQPPPSAPRIPADVMAARAHLSANLERKVTIDEVARVAHLSRSHLMAKFKRHFGVSLIDWLVNERLEKAKTLLVYSSRSVKEIAGQCGFNSAFYFNKTFKARTGVTPGQFRRSGADAVD